MKACETTSSRTGYKLAQLCQAADFHPSTIHHYIRIGLLHRPRKIGLGLYLYDETHLNKLGKIRDLRQRENLTLLKIKERLKGDPKTHHQRESIRTGDARSSHKDVFQAFQASPQAEMIKKRIVDVATERFAKKGYEGTTISGITEALDMSKGSFYLYFKDKRELFIACIERLAHAIVPEKTNQEISKEKDHVARQVKRAIAFLEAFPSCAGILSLIRITAMDEDQDLAEKGREAFRKIVEPVLMDSHRAVAEGVIREVDAELLAYLVLGMAESIGYKITTEPECDLHQCVEKCIDILAHGLVPRAGACPKVTEPRHRSAEITDVRGETVKVREIRFRGKPYLTGRIGEGEIQVETERVAFLLLDHTGSACRVEVTTTDGERTSLEQDANLIISAASPVGLYTIPLRHVHSISFA